MDEQSLVVRQGGHTTNRTPQQMNSNRSSNQSQGKANGKNRSKKSQKAAQPKKARQRRRTQSLVGPRASGALQLHSAQSDSAMSTFFRFRPTRDARGAVIEGRDLCAQVIPATSAAGTFQIAKFTVDTLSNFVTRWQTYGTLFQKYRIHKLRATLVAGQGTTTVGFNFLAWDSTQVSVSDPSTAEGVMRMEGSSMAVAYANIQSDFPAEAQLKWYDTTGVAGPTTAVGQLFAATSGYTAAVVPGLLMIDYEIEFIEPR